MQKILLLLGLLILTVAACTTEESGKENVDSSDFAMPNRPGGLASVRVQNVIDGDTVDLADGTRVRLLGINTPEREELLYQEAKDYLKSLVEGETVYIEYDEERLDQFDRTLAYLWLDNRLVNAEMLVQGYASAYIFPPNTRYEATLNNAEAFAESKAVGIWEKGEGGLEIKTIFYDAPGPDEENPNGEYIEVVNISDASINLRGYSVQDTSSSHLYTFGSFSLNAGATVRIYSGCGSDNNREIYWCGEGSVWNNGGDTGFLRDPNGGLVDTYEYSN